MDYQSRTSYQETNLTCRNRTMKRSLILYTFVCILMAVSGTASAQRIAVGINSIEAALLSPNIEVGISVGERTSLHFDVCHSNKPYNLDFRLLSVGGECKYWISGAPLVRLYVGGRLQYSNYDYFRQGTRRYGDALIIGPTVGYDLVLGKRWALEFSTGAGAAFYYGRQGENGTETPDSGISFVPIKFGVSFILILI